jgi:hypothetical protein
LLDAVTVGSFAAPVALVVPALGATLSDDPLAAPVAVATPAERLLDAVMAVSRAAPVEVATPALGWTLPAVPFAAPVPVPTPDVGRAGCGGDACVDL